ncbi:hypothetical protein FDP41_004245 [Naegleria fowleri]|uniref:Nascent polypeptide-associated complex subunit beta n=1 Tax=Naegleria fowleri TaxID=5763 RepID=A0A6A5BT48_NAEFO|nr:uncharacterized protein FDP41_004245 [Naegleria fowleri]KAF0976950.1 hypothetical protein FDP41_004245 [Naegleria fowleri]
MSDTAVEQQPTTTTPAQPKKNGKEKYKFEVNQAKLEQLKKTAKEVVIAGGMRRKHKVVKKTSQNEGKIRNIVNKWRMTNIPEVMEVTMLMEDGTITTLQAPKVEAAVHSNSFVITGKYQRLTMEQYLPSMLKQLQNYDPSQLQQLFAGLNKEAGEKSAPQQEKGEELPEVSSFENVQ